MVRNKYRRINGRKIIHKRNGYGMRNKHTSVESGGGGFGIVLIVVFIIILVW